MKLTDVLISSKHVGDANNRMLQHTSVGLDRITSVVLHHTIAAVMDYWWVFTLAKAFHYKVMQYLKNYTK